LLLREFFDLIGSLALLFGFYGVALRSIGLVIAALAFIRKIWWYNYFY